MNHRDSFPGEEISLVDLLRTLIKHKNVILALTILGVLSSILIIVFRKEKSIVVSTTMLVPPQTSQLRNLVYQTHSLQEIVKSLDLINSFEIKEKDPRKALIAASSRLANSLEIDVGLSLASESKVDEKKVTSLDAQTITLSVKDTSQVRAERILEAVARNVEVTMNSFQRGLNLTSVSMIMEKSPDFDVIQKHSLMNETLMRIVKKLALTEYYKLTSDESSVDLLKTRVSLTEDKANNQEFSITVKDPDHSKAVAILQEVLNGLKTFDRNAFVEGNSYLVSSKATLYPHPAQSSFREFLTSAHTLDKLVKKHNLISHYNASSLEQARLIAQNRLGIQTKGTYVKESGDGGKVLPLVGVSTSDGYKQIILNDSQEFFQVTFSDVAPEKALACLESLMEQLAVWLNEFSPETKSVSRKGATARTTLELTPGMMEAQKFLLSAKTLSEIAREMNLVHHYSSVYSLSGFQNVIERLERNMSFQQDGSSLVLEVVDPEPLIASSLLKVALKKISTMTESRLAQALEEPYAIEMRFSQGTLTAGFISRLTSTENLERIVLSEQGKESKSRKISPFGIKKMLAFQPAGEPRPVSFLEDISAIDSSSEKEKDKGKSNRHEAPSNFGSQGSNSNAEQTGLPPGLNLQSKESQTQPAAQVLGIDRLWVKSTSKQEAENLAKNMIALMQDEYALAQSELLAASAHPALLIIGADNVDSIKEMFQNSSTIATLEKRLEPTISRWGTLLSKSLGSTSDLLREMNVTALEGKIYITADGLPPLISSKALLALRDTLKSSLPANNSVSLVGLGRKGVFPVASLPLLAVVDSSTERTLPPVVRHLTDPFVVAQQHTLQFLDKPTITYRVPGNLRVKPLRGPFVQENIAIGNGIYRIIEPAHIDLKRSVGINKSILPTIAAVMISAVLLGTIIAFLLEAFQKYRGQLFGHTLGYNVRNDSDALPLLRRSGAESANYPDFPASNHATLLMNSQEHTKEVV
jgi:capsular polysaccharide biosynthesis protein